MKKPSLLIIILLVTMLVTAGVVLAQPLNLKAHLSAEPGVDSQGQGQAKFQLEDNVLSFIMPVSKLEGDTTAAHIHISPDPGGNGPIFVSLCGAFGPAPIPVADCGGPGNPAKGSIELSEQQITDLMEAIATNRAYVNVHTTVFGGGEIRGQLVTNN